MSQCRAEDIFSNVLDFEMATHCIVYVELLFVQDCDTVFTIEEQNIISKYYQGI